jgi:hypothetical protein
MGFAKEQLMRQYARGFAYLDGFVCPDCVDDAALKAYIQDGVTENKCNFCQRESDRPIAAEADTLLDHISEVIQTEYSFADDELGWEDGEYVGRYFDMVELLDDDLESPLGDGPFAEAVKGVASDAAWCERNYYATKEHEALRYDWELFQRTVMYESRFMFLQAQDAPAGEELIVGHPVRRGAAILGGIARQIERGGLIKHLPAGQVVYRARTSRSDATYTTAKDLGAAPATRASTSRMSPAGIAMFYAAGDPETAIAEAAETADTIASVGRFVTNTTCSVIDLDQIPTVPSIFDRENSDTREALRFLQGFRHDIMRSIERDGREHVAYVPTQIVTEYLRLVYRLNEEGEPPLDGLIFTSSRTGGKNWVLFVDNSRCIEMGQTAPDDHLSLTLEDAKVYHGRWKPDFRERRLPARPRVVTDQDHPGEPSTDYSGPLSA